MKLPRFKITIPLMPLWRAVKGFFDVQSVLTAEEAHKAFQRRQNGPTEVVWDSPAVPWLAKQRKLTIHSLVTLQNVMNTEHAAQRGPLPADPTMVFFEMGNGIASTVAIWRHSGGNGNLLSFTLDGERFFDYAILADKKGLVCYGPHGETMFGLDTTDAYAKAIGKDLRELLGEGLPIYAAMYRWSEYEKGEAEIDGPGSERAMVYLGYWELEAYSEVVL